MQSNNLCKIWRANRLYMHCMAGMEEHNFNWAGGEVWKLAWEMRVCWGRGPGASSPRTFWNVEARKWYFQHSQWHISLKKLNLDKVLNKNIFPLEKLPSPQQPPRLCRPCMGMDNRGWHILGYPTTVFCKTSVRRTKYCPEFSITWGWLKISRGPFHSCTIIIFLKLI